MAKVISMSLSTASIRKAIQELEAYSQSLKQRSDTLCLRIAELIRNYAQEGFSSAVADTAINRASKSANVEVTVEKRGDSAYAVVASGEDAVWVEFGAGVYYNGAAGSSPHPKGSELGFMIGGYGKGHGRRQVWGYMDSEGLVLTRGTPAAMPMYNAFVRAKGEIESIAREVFGL